MSYGKLMAVMMPREKWTDERLDDLNKKVDDGFARLDGDIMGLRQDMNARFNAVDARFDSVDARFDSLNAKFDTLRRDLFKAAVAVIVAMIGGAGAIAAALIGTSVL
jgi:tetrahydromethanopterin S-methyltransferase subunit G